MTVYTALMTESTDTSATILVVAGDLIEPSCRKPNVDNPTYIEDRIEKLRQKGKALRFDYDRSTKAVTCAENQELADHFKAIMETGWRVGLLPKKEPGSASTFTV